MTTSLIFLAIAAILLIFSAMAFSANAVAASALFAGIALILGIRHINCLNIWEDDPEDK